MGMMYRPARQFQVRVAHAHDAGPDHDLAGSRYGTLRLADLRLAR